MIYQNLNKDKRQDNSVCGDARTPQPRLCGGYFCWDSVNAPTGRVCKCWARAETKHSTSFQRWWPFLFSHSLTHLPPLIRYLLVPFSGGGEGDNLGNFPPPPSPLSSFTLMSHQLIAFLRFQLRFHRFQTQSWRLRTWDMLIERSLTQIYALREVLCSVSTGYRNLSFELSLRFKTVSTSVMV